MAIRERLAHAGVLVLLASLGWQMGVTPVLSAAAPADIVAMPELVIRDGLDAHAASQREPTDTRVEDRAQPGTAEELGRIAALTSILDRQGSRSAGNLERVAAIEVINLTASPEFVVDTRQERAAAAEAAVAAALAADQVDDEAQVAAVVATQEAETSAAVAAALAADRKDDDARAAALAATREAEVAAADATAKAEAQAVASAAQAAEAATAQAEARAEAAMESNRQFVQRATMLLLALALLGVGMLCLRFWRKRKEPFVLKAIPGSGSVHAHA